MSGSTRRDVRRSTRGRRRAAGLAVVLAATVVLAACDPPKPPNDCPEIPGLDKWTWVGSATDPMTQKAKWHHPGDDGTHGFPGSRNAPEAADDYVCVPDDKTLVIGAGESLHVQVLDNQGRVEVRVGGRLDLRGNDTDRASSSNELLLQGLLFGSGRLTTVPGGLLHWDKQPTGPSSMSSNEPAPPAPLPSVDPGTTVIGPGATLRVEGSTGVDVRDRRTLVNMGTTEVVDDAYVALADSTTFVNHGTVDFQGDGDVQQGTIDASPSPTFENRGLVQKSSGSGLTFFDVPYVRYAPGTVAVATGQLSVWNDVSVAGTVALGATLATAGCGITTACLPGQTVDTQFASVARASGSGSPATVTITEVAVSEPGTRGRPVDLTAPAASNANPMTIRLGVRGDLLEVGDTAANLDVTHDAGTALPDCPPSLPIAGACVDRAASTGSKAAGSVVMVVKTPTNGRWRLR